MCQGFQDWLMWQRDSGSEFEPWEIALFQECWNAAVQECLAHIERLQVDGVNAKVGNDRKAQ